MFLRIHYRGSLSVKYRLERNNTLPNRNKTEHCVKQLIFYMSDHGIVLMSAK